MARDRAERMDEGDGEILSRCRSCDPGALLASEWSALAVSGAAGTPQLFSTDQPQPIPDAEGLDIHSHAVSIEARHDRALACYWASLSRAAGGTCRNVPGGPIQRAGADDLAQVAANAATGRVGTLLIEVDRHIPGRIDAGEGRD